jgi:hypothetical protein
MDVDGRSGRKQKARLPVALRHRCHGPCSRAAPAMLFILSTVKQPWVSLLRFTAAEHPAPCCAWQGRGFREPMDVEDRARGGDYESVPMDRQGPGPAKCELSCRILCSPWLVEKSYSPGEGSRSCHATWIGGGCCVYCS